MESAQVNLGPVWRYARGGTKGWASGGAEEAIRGIEKELTRRTGSAVTLPGAAKNTIRLSPYVGIGGMLQWGTQYAITFDRNARARSLVQTDNVALTGHVRGAVNLGPVGAWTNQSVIGARWITNKSLDLTDPQDVAAAKRLWIEGSMNPPPAPR
ncbi:hypothetical protein [Actinomadura sp. HBU206391]|uniref:hypothetical protein n=1 Tax=Actinomadura sp. HBU206391 TaxID=2731692 RepID=UPI00164FABD7|nr:hypothetical protein [Actinomadura sp. HBU206391]MBC6461395.1 hypothetical protein [Actinomadura sp. HBU206391]